MRPARFGAVLTAMITPFAADGSLDLDGAVALARWLADHGNDGLVLAATTGEASTLTDTERLELARAVSAAVTVPVLLGTGTNGTAHSIALTREALGAGAAGVIVVGPYYNRPPQAGIEAHFRAVCGATKLPVMLYDVPGRTGRRIAQDVLARLFREVPNAVAFKDATGDAAGAAALVARAGEHFDLYSGDDAMTLPLLASGAVGVVGTTTHWTGPHFQRMIRAFHEGRVGEARAVNALLLDSFAYVNDDDCVYSMSVKAMMRSIGLAAGQCRLPLPPSPPGKEEQARRVFAAL